MFLSHNLRRRSSVMPLGAEILRYQTKRVTDIKRSSIDCNVPNTLYLNFVSLYLNTKV